MAVLLTVILLGCGSSEPGVFFADLGAPRSFPSRDTANVNLDVAAEYGSDHGELWFSVIGDVAADPRGAFLAVAELDRCHITVIERDTGSFRRFGTCGDGPGGFVELGKIAFVNDELLALDNRRRTLLRFALDGTEIGRIDPEVLDSSTPYFSSFDSFGPRSLFVGLRSLPVVQGVSDHRLVAVVNMENGKTLRRLVDDTPMAKATLRPFLRGVETCVGVAGGSTRAVVANIWSTQLLVLNENLQVVANVATALTWRRPASRDGQPRSWRPPSYLPGLACGTDYFMVLYQKREAGPGGEAIISQGHLEIRDYDGRLVFSRGATAPERGSVFHLLPSAGAGDRFFAFTSTFTDFPLVREYRVYEP